MSELPAGPTPTSYMFASARIDITPIDPAPLAGAVEQLTPWHTIDSRLEANALLLSDGETRILFVSADLLYVGAELVAALEEHAAARGLPREHLLLSASHTHFAPTTDLGKPRLGTYDVGYNEFLRTQLIDLIDRILAAPLQTGDLRASHELTTLNISRRRRWPHPTLTAAGLRFSPSYIMAPNKDAPRDAAIDVLAIRDRGGRITAVVWKFACHPTGLPTSSGYVSAEFPGRVREAVREAFGDEVDVLFWQGFTGDVRPNLPGQHTLRQRLRHVRTGPTFGPVEFPEWNAWCDQLRGAVLAAIRSSGARPISGALALTAGETPLSSILPIEDNPHLRGRGMRIVRVAFGDTLTVWFLGAEVCSPYLGILAAGPQSICVGYTGEVFGYLPSESQAREGGYEAGGYFERFGLKGALLPGFEARVRDVLSHMGARTAA